MNKYFKYLLSKQTIISITAAVMFIFTAATIVELELLFRCEEKVNFEELNMKNLAKFCTIEQLERTLKSQSNNPLILIKLADIYDSLDDNTKANNYYKEALRVSQRSNFALYKYALFLSKNNMINMATSLAEEMSGSNIKTFQYKANIYELIGKKLDEIGEFEGSNKAYQVAHKYAKNMKDKKYLDKIETKYAESFVKVADLEIKEGRIDDAIYLIKNSFEIKKTPIGAYKLGLIYKNTNPKEAERLFGFALKNNPYIVNPYVYNKLLEDLYTQANLINKDSEINYYSTKIAMFKKLTQKAYLYKDDISITNIKVFKDTNSKEKKKPYILTFDVNNNTKNNINKLIAKVEIFTNDDNFEVQSNLFGNMNTLDAQTSQNYTIDLPKELKKSDLYKETVAYFKFYAKKDKKAPWTLFGIKQINL